jgi:hypothetical protein
MTADLALERFVAWSPRILAAFAASACVETTRFLIEVLKRLEIDARPLPVKFIATCHAAGYQFVAGASDAEIALIARGKKLGFDVPDPTPEQVAQFAAEWNNEVSKKKASRG